VRRLGFVCRDAKLFLLDEAIRDQTIEHRDHPLALATRWTAAGFSAMAALSWVCSGILAPDAAHRSITAEANVTTPAARLIPLLVATARRSFRRLPPTTPQRG